MTFERIGSTWLQTIGEGVEGELTFVRLVLDGAGGFLTTNSDPLVTGIDPQTGEVAAEGTDLGFAAPIRRFMQAGVYNGDFASRPSNFTFPIGDESFGDRNRLGYYVYRPAIGSNITATWMADSGSGSGGVVRWNVPSSDGASDRAYIEQLVPIIASRGRNWAWWPVVEFGPATFGAGDGHQGYLEAQFLKSDGVTTTGSVELVQTALSASTNTVLTASVTHDAGVAPADAAWMRVRAGVQRGSAATTDSCVVDMYEIWLVVGTTDLLLVDQSDPSTYDPTWIRQDTGRLVFSPDGDETFRAQSAIGIQPAAVSIGTIAPASALHVVTSSTRWPALTLKGAVSMSSNIMNVLDSTGADLLTVDEIGRVGVYEGQPAAQFEVESAAAARIAAIIRGAASQSANLFVIEKSDGTDYWAIGPNGQVRAGGTAFPSSPSSDDLFYRTDRDLWYFYDGTQWLSSTLYTLHFQGRQAAHTGSVVGEGRNTVPFHAAYDLWLVNWQCTTYCSPTANGTNYWTVGLHDGTNNSLISQATINSASVYGVTTNTLGSALAATCTSFDIRVTKTGAPSDLYDQGSVLTYRLIG